MRETERGEGAGGRGLAAPPHRQAQPAAALRHSPEIGFGDRERTMRRCTFFGCTVLLLRRARGSRVMPAGRSQARVTARHIGCKFKQKRLKSLVKTCEGNRSLRSVGSRETSNRSDPIASGRPTWC